MRGEYRELRERLAEIHDLGRAAALLAWDERTMMPPRGAEARAEQLATLARVRHAMFASDEIGRLLDVVRPDAERMPSDSEEASLVRVVGRDWEKARRVPAELRADIARASSLGEATWREARLRSDYRLLLPRLERNVELKRRFAACYEGFEGFEHPYDPLLDEFEPGMSTHEMRALLEELREGLVPLIAAIGERAGAVDDSFLHGSFPVEAQRKLVAELLAELPFERDSWRLDPTAHPFASAISRRDVRLTVRYDAEHLPTALFTALHEAGHGLYDAGVDPALDRTPLGRHRSLGLHESQSRLWENWIGRSRAYLSRIHPKLQATFPAQLEGVDPEDLYRGANRVRPSLIRTEADEVTYNLHILLRFRLELDIVEDRVALRDLPEAWGGLMREYLGVEVPDDARGVLQDVHWAGGSIGYFPTYSLGNVLAAQLWEAAARDLGDLEGAVARGELHPLGSWLRDNVHRHGRKLTTAELISRVTGGPIEAGPYLRHLRGKLGEIYGLPDQT
jgi:carboxypeptidase Taq